MSLPAQTIKENFIASLAGRYHELSDAQTISAATSRRFNTYPYVRKLVISEEPIEARNVCATSLKQI